MVLTLKPTDAEYIVFRKSPNFPKKWMSEKLDGKWEHFPSEKPDVRIVYMDTIGINVMAVPTSTYEVDDEGNVAQVYLINFRKE